MGKTVRDRAIDGGLLRPDRCAWSPDSEGPDIWATECGELFYLTCQTPHGNKMRFCCYCGGALVEGCDR